MVLSLPSWERGLKLHLFTFILSNLYVAPLVGAWIEIVLLCNNTYRYTVAPLVGAWIEILTYSFPCTVAPLVGAWIEIFLGEYNYHFPQVAPLVGAWIEIREIKQERVHYPSLPSWERGLKYSLIY